MRAILAVAGLVVSATAGAQPASAPSAEVRRVLAVYADDRLLPANQQVDAALRQALDGASYRIDYFAEFLDAARFPGRSHLEASRDYFELKYRAHPPDVVVAVSKTVLDFFVTYRDRLFPGVPIVHAGLTDDELPGDPLDPGVAGVTGAWELRGALELARRLQPERTNVFVVNGASPREEARLRGFRDAAADLHDLRFTWLVNHSLAALEAAVQRLPADAVILVFTFYEGADGQFHVPRDVVRRLALVANAPIYAPFESFVGYGSVGGTMETWHATGQTAGRLVLQILGGAAPQAAAAGVRMPLATIVDWRQIERWGIDPARLPPETETRFRQPTLWEAYRPQVLAGAAVGVVQLLLIATLVLALQRRRAAEVVRRQAEARAAQLRVELAHTARVTLLGELAASLAHELNQPLAAILSNAQATRRWLRSGQPNLAEVGTAVDDIIADDKRAGEIIHRMRGLLKKEHHDPAPVDVGKAVMDVANLVHGALIAANVTLDLDVPAAPVVVDANEVEIQQVVLNLLTNGIQSIQEAAATTRRVRVEVRADAGRIVVTVHDTGNGIPDEVRDKLFQPFFTTKTRGLGVGLNICRRIAEAHGGRLEVAESPLGGAAFALSLPAAAPA